MGSVITAPQPEAIDAGARVLMRGGNAIDAAVTCAFVQGVTSPQMCGIGGYTLLNIHPAGGASSDGLSTILDAPAIAGSKATPDVFADKVIRPNPDGWGFFLKEKINDLGYKSVCTPGAVQGLSTMLDRWGTISWKKAIEPAIELAEKGLRVDEAMMHQWSVPAGYPDATSFLDRISTLPEVRRIYLNPDGSRRDIGERIPNPDLGKTLSHLAEHGPDDFYRGELAKRMCDDLTANDAFVTPEDFDEYRLREERPVVTKYRDYVIATVEAPHGGPTLAEILNILDGYDLSKFEHNSPDYIYLVAMAMKAAFADRNLFLGDPDYVDARVDWMASKERAAEWRRTIDSGQPFEAAFTPPEPPDTTHVCVVDDMGNCVSLTHSLGMSSDVVTPGLGFMYNNSMTNFYPYPDHPNSIEPRKGRTTGMTPTIVYKNGAPVLVIGAPGATRIITSILQVIVNFLDFKMSLSDALLAPRIDCQGPRIRCQSRIPEFVVEEVEKRHVVERLPYAHGGLAWVNAISIDPETGKRTGASDAASSGFGVEVERRN